MNNHNYDSNELWSQQEYLLHIIEHHRLSIKKAASIVRIPIDLAKYYVMEQALKEQEADEIVVDQKDVR